ncbi:redoxin domain-containing protein [Streptomyces sp. YIM 98790]|uniref:redoxin domain-containing protein n=1 Tax=Streptomyces sp. YIM 98790 TaxID=2689077 RepID=UPI0014095CB1|nr:redoxin domain-containing protein [Streptomyces sp. YIM 98790]
MRTGKPVAVLAASAAALLVLAACGSDDPAEPGSGAGAPSSATGGTQPDEQPQVPAELDFSTTTVTGEDFEGASLAGSPAVLWFWAPWCAVCAGEAAGVRAAQEEWGEQITFVGIPGKGSPEDDLKFVTDHHLDGFEHARDTDGLVWSGFGVVSQPAFAFLDADGSIETVPGALDEAELDARLAALAEG